MAHADFEITSGILRVFDKEDPEFGEPFQIMVAVVGDEGVAILKGMRIESNAFTVSVKRAIFARLKERGFHTALWHRYKGGTKREVRIRL